MRIVALAVALAGSAACIWAKTSIPLRLTNPAAPDALTNVDRTLRGRLARESRRINARFGSESHPNPRGLVPRAQGQLYDIATDSFYVMDVDIGTPAQTLSLLLDTGSSDVIMTTEACHTAACAGLVKFEPVKSSTLQNSSQQFSITYGSGAATGTMVSDTISVGGYTVVSQSFALIDQMQDSIVTAPTSGIFGLGLQQLSAAGVTPFAQVLAKENVLDEPIFTVQLARAGDSARVQNTSTYGKPPEPDSLLGGIFTLGSLDESQYEGDINWIDVPSNAIHLGYWSLKLEKLKLNGTPQDVDLIAVLDTGTTYWAGPHDFVKAFYSKIDGSATQNDFAQGRYSIPCDSKVNVTLTFGGEDYAINHTDFNGGTINNGTDCLGALFASDDLSSTSSSSPSFIIGATFLKNVFFAANMSGPSIGLASLSRDGQTQAVATQVPTPAVAVSFTAGSTASSSSYTGTTSSLLSSGSWTSTSSGMQSSPSASSNQPSGPGLGEPSTSTLTSAVPDAPRSLALALPQSQGTSFTVEVGKGYALAADAASTESQPSSTLSVGSGSVLATASDGSLFASSTAGFTPITAKAPAVTGSAVYWVSGLSSPRGFANTDRAAASVILHGNSAVPTDRAASQLVLALLITGYMVWLG